MKKELKLKMIIGIKDKIIIVLSVLWKWMDKMTNYGSVLLAISFFICSVLAFGKNKKIHVHCVSPM